MSLTGNWWRCAEHDLTAKPILVGEVWYCPADDCTAHVEQVHSVARDLPKQSAQRWNRVRRSPWSVSGPGTAAPTPEPKAEEPAAPPARPKAKPPVAPSSEIEKPERSSVVVKSRKLEDVVPRVRRRREHILAAVDQKDTARLVQLVRDLVDVDVPELLAEIQRLRPAGVAVDARNKHRPRTSRPVRDAILVVLRRAGQPMSYADLAVALAAQLGVELTDSRYTNWSSASSRMARDGELIKPAYGIYALPEMEPAA